MKRATELVARTESCAFCPNLCLHACPVSTAEGSDVVSPWGKMSMTRWLALGRARLAAENVAVLYHCTSCGACRSACAHEVDVAEALRIAREDAVTSGVAAYPADRFPVPREHLSDAVLPPGVSGYRLWLAGYRSRFETVARLAASRWEGRRELVFAAAGDVRCVREAYPEVGLRLSQAVLLAAERPGAAPMGEVVPPVAYHEACNIARCASIDAEAVRSAARRAAGGKLVELRWRTDTATCCGASGAYSAISPDGARAAARRILENASLKGARTLLAGCARCVEHLDSARGDLDIRVVALT